MENIKVIITGATGMVGEGVLHECLQSPRVDAVLVVNRKPCGISHPKLSEIIHSDFYDISGIVDQMMGYNACFFCLGVSSVGMKEDEYFHKTYTLTLHFATVLSKAIPNLTFCYISGAATDSTESGKSMWARVKGKTENDLMKLPFKKVYAFRPGYLHPTPGLKNTLKYYTYLSWLYPILKSLFPNSATKLSELGQAMIQCVNSNYKTPIIEVKNILELAHSKG